MLRGKAGGKAGVLRMKLIVRRAARPSMSSDAKKVDGGRASRNDATPPALPSTLPPAVVPGVARLELAEPAPAISSTEMAG